MAASFFASIAILFARPFQVGDRVTFDGYYGEIRSIGMRSVRLQTLDDNLVTIPSGKFLTDSVANANAGALDCMVVIPFYLRPDADLQRAKSIISDAVLASRYLYLGKDFSVISNMELSAEGRGVLQIQAKAYVYDARYEKAFVSDVTEQALDWLRRESVGLA